MLSVKNLQFQRRKRSSRIVSMRPLGSLEIKEDSGTKKVNKYLKLRKQ